MVLQDTVIIGDPGWIRTSDLQLRRLLLYPLSYGAVRAFLIGVARREYPVGNHSILAARAFGILAHEHNSVPQCETLVRPLLDHCVERGARWDD
jgi:hypothetical protein